MREQKGGGVEFQTGFETIGNATLVCHDQRPVLVTDPWVTGSAYYGSWKLSHEIPAEIGESICQAEYVWVSHGHPDHLSLPSLELLRGKTILLADHVGSRMYLELRANGYRVEIMEDRKWYTLSPKIRIACHADYNQDAVLLVEIAGQLVVNLNDASDNIWGPWVRKLIAAYRKSYLLALTGYGDAYMINYFDESCHRIPPIAAAKAPVGLQIRKLLATYRATHFIPFSSMHKYQRTDSAWANEYATDLESFARGCSKEDSRLFPAFVRVDCIRDRWERIDPPATNDALIEPMSFGDHWDEPLEKGDFERVRAYMRGVEHLQTWLDFINFRVAGQDHRIALSRRGFTSGITFEVPRRSLMHAVDCEVFDDILIGNFMRTTLHGPVKSERISRDFTPWVAKYADNGLARNQQELELYFEAYRRRAPLDYLQHRLSLMATQTIRELLPRESYQLAKRGYYALVT